MIRWNQDWKYEVISVRKGFGEKKFHSTKLASPVLGLLFQQTIRQLGKGVSREKEDGLLRHRSPLLP